MVQFRKICVFATVLLSSMAGASVGDISLTKIAFIPLILALLTELKTKFSLGRMERKLLLIYFLIIASSFYGLLNTGLFKYDTYEYKLITNIIQYLIIYIPVLLLLSNSKHYFEFKEDFTKAIIFLAKLNCIWAIIQFVVWVDLRIDFNDLVFNTYLHGLLGSNWSVYDQAISGDALIRNLRVAGLNYESACFSFIMLLGYALDDKTWHKFVYLAVILLALSRAGIVVSILLLAIEAFKFCRKMNKRKLQYFLVGLFILVIGCYVILKSPIGTGINNQIQVLLTRFMLVNKASYGSGTYRHIMYPVWAVQCWLFNLDPLQKLFGVGYRVSGVAFSESTSIQGYLQNIMSTQAWAIENDFADTLLGIGVVGIALLYSFLWQINKTGDIYSKKIVFIIFFFGLLYNVSIWSFSTIIYIYLMLCCDNSHRKSCMAV